VSDAVEAGSDAEPGAGAQAPVRRGLSVNRMIIVASAIITVVALGLTWYLVLSGRSSGSTASPAPEASATTLPAGVPAGWPTEVPVFQPATVFDTERVDSSGGTYFGLTLQVADNDAVKAAYDFYRRELAGTFSIQVDTPNETAFGFYANLIAADDERTVNVVAATDTKLVIISISPAGRA
jgi:hypothetical protein